jgi:hypothetical protein
VTWQLGHVRAGADRHCRGGEDFVPTAVRENYVELQPGTDLAYLAGGYACLTRVNAVRDAADIDVALSLPDTFAFQASHQPNHPLLTGYPLCNNR